MKNRPSRDIILWALAYIFIGILTLLPSLISFFDSSKVKSILYDLPNGILLIVLGVNLFKLMEWARKGAMIYSAFASVILLWNEIHMAITDKIYVVRSVDGFEEFCTTFGILLTVGIVVAQLYFFTRPKVKEQFN